MTTNTNGESPHDCRLSRFERNRFYHNKLMTARDMAAEQRFHADRLDTFARHVAGEGIVDGLGVTVTGTAAAEMTVEVPAGIGIDCCGRLIVVDDTTTKTVTLAESSVGQTVHLYLEYSECVKETVPLLGSESACDQQCEYNRVLETFDVVTGEHPYEVDTPEEANNVYKRIPKIDFPEPKTVGADAESRREALFGMAQSYHKHGGTLRRENSEQCRVYLGSVSPQDQNGSTQWDPEDIMPGFVYTADMLFAILGGHLLEANPHQLDATDVGALETIEGVGEPGGNVDIYSPDDSVIVGTAGPDPTNGFPDPRVTLHAAAIASLEGVENDGGNVDIHSPDGSVIVDTDPNPASGDPRVTLRSAAIRSLEGLENHGGNVDLHSPDGSVRIGTETPAGSDPRVTLEVAGMSDEELDRYLMDRALKYTQEAYGRVAERFESHVADALQWVAGVGLDEEVFTDPDRFFEFLRGRSVAVTVQGDDEELTVVELMAQLERDLEGLVVTEDLRRYTDAVEELEQALGDDERTARTVAVTLDYASETATWLWWNLTCVDFDDEFSEGGELDPGGEYEDLTFFEGATFHVDEIRHRPGEQVPDRAREEHEVTFEGADEVVFEGLHTSERVGIRVPNPLADNNDIVIDLPQKTRYVEVSMVDIFTHWFETPEVYFLDAYSEEGEGHVPVDRDVRVFSARPDREFSLSVQGEGIDRLHITTRFGEEQATEALVLKVCYHTEP